MKNASPALAYDLSYLTVNGPRSRAELSSHGRGSGRHCIARKEGDVVCNKATREGKPYCSDHVEHLSYVKDLLAELDTKERQVEQVKKNPQLARASELIATEILLQLRLHGERTVERLARDLREESDVIRAYAAALKRNCLVKIGRTPRGSQLVRLAG